MIMMSEKEDGKKEAVETACVKPHVTQEERYVSFAMAYTAPHRRKVNTSKLKKCFQKRRRTVFLGISAAVIVLLIVWFFKVYGSGNFNSTCSNTWKDSAAACGRSTFGCGKVETVLAACSSRSSVSWRIFTWPHPVWKTYKRRLHGLLDESKSILISPYFAVPQDTCSFKLSLCQLKYSTYVLTDERGEVDVYHVTSKQQGQGCTESIYLNSSFLTKARYIQLSVAIIGKTDRARYSLHLQPCVKYRAIAEFFNEKALVGTPPNLPAVMDHNENRCSFEYDIDHRLKCDWWTVETSADHRDGEFEIADSAGCISNGLISIPRGEKWFMVLATPPKGGRTTSAFTISPAFRAHVNYVSLSYYYHMPCGGGVISAYITPPPQANFRVKDYIRAWSPFSQVYNQTSKWTRVDIDLPVPQWKDNGSFHVLLHAELDGSGICNNTECHLGKPMIAIEEIRTQLRFDQCKKVKEGHEILSCDFDDKATCNWISSGDTMIMLPDWTIAPSDNSVNNATGRGHILSFDPMGKANYEGAFLRSPTVVAKSNCSCNMRMSYLMAGKHAPRLTVYVKYGTDVVTDGRPHNKLWSVIGHQSDGWLEVDILINLVDNLPPFQIELRISQILDSRGFVHVDNLRFHNCDVAFVANATSAVPSYYDYPDYPDYEDYTS